MQLAAAALTLLASVGLTYFFCVRPMRQGRGCGTCPPGGSGEAPEHVTQATAHDLQAAWAELAAVRAAMAHRPEPGPAVGAEAGHGPAVRTASWVDGD